MCSEFYRCHTLAFIPSHGRVYAFGQGGSGQLGLMSSCNMNSPQLIAGPWIEPNSSTHMDVDQDDSVIIDEPAVQLEAVRSIFCGGDQSFALVTSDMVVLIQIHRTMYEITEIRIKMSL